MKLHVSSPRSQVIHLDYLRQKWHQYIPPKKLAWTWTFKIGRIPKEFLSSSKTMDFQRRAASHRSLPMKTNGKFYPSITTGVLALNQCTYQLVQECPGYFLSINVSLGYSKCHPFNKKRASENSWEVNGRSWRGEKSYIPNVRIWKPTWNYNILLRCAWNVTSSFGDRSSCRVILNNQPVSCLPLVGSTTRVNTAR